MNMKWLMIDCASKFGTIIRKKTKKENHFILLLLIQVELIKIKHNNNDYIWLLSFSIFFLFSFFFLSLGFFLSYFFRVDFTVDVRVFNDGVFLAKTTQRKSQQYNKNLCVYFINAVIYVCMYICTWKYVSIYSYTANF